MDDSTPFQTAFSFLLRPRLLLQGVVEYMMAWAFTRRWLLWFFLLLPAWALAATAVGLTWYGFSIPDRDLATQYAEWIEVELPDAPGTPTTEGGTAPDDGEVASNGESETTADPAGDDLEESTNAEGGTANASSTNETLFDDERLGEALADIEEVTPYGDLLLRRLLQIQNSSSWVTYVVALQQARKGRAGQAQQMLRRIAPKGGGGFGPAHTWLAMKQIQQGVIPEDEKDTLAADLEAGRTWKRFPAELLAVYANLLESQNKIGPALQVMEEASNRDSRLAVPLAAMAARNGRDQRRNRATSKAKADIRAKMDAKEDTLEDLLQLANIFLMEKAPDKAIQVIEELALKKSPEGDDLLRVRRIQSNAYLASYVSSAVFTRGQFKVNLALLDAALKADPQNPNVGSEVARLMAAGKNAPPELTEALKTQLANGSATALTHMLLAVGKLYEGDLKQAVPHLRIANRQAPNNPMTLNNLALALARIDKTNLEESLALSKQAVALAPQSAEYLDTQGELRLMAGDSLGAVESYEAALSRDNSRIGTREALAKIYSDLEMTEMAEAQEKEIEKLKQENASNDRP